MATSQVNTQHVWNVAKQKGLTRASKSNFWWALRNPLYCGKIFIPKYKDEEAIIVDGNHEAIISEALFYKVQDILDGRKKIMRPKIKIDSDFPLRGYILCPKCGRKLTGSTSRGSSGGRYHYYHCTSKCGVRIDLRR